ncbi:MAG TPA: DNA repair protein RecO [Planctomycetota bacterium]
MTRPEDAAERAAPAERRLERALLLRRFPYGESSLVLHALTPGHGRVTWLAKGAYRPSSGFFAVFDLFDTLEVRWSARPHQELGLVTRATLLTRRAGLALDLARYRVALGLLELAHLTAREEHEERALFRWLEQGLDLLVAGQASPGLVRLAAQLGLLRANGLEPALEACASCGAAEAERARTAAFSFAMGGRLCARCAAEARARGRSVEELPAGLVRVAASLAALPPGRLAHTRLEPALEQRLGVLVERFLSYHLETGPRTVPHGRSDGHLLPRP